VEFRLLGPLEVVGDGGRAVPLGAGRRRALLAYLLLRPNEHVPSDRLIDALWGESPPATAAQMVQNQVSALRRELGANGRLETRGSAYRLSIAPGERDLDRFEKLVAAGRTRLELDPAGAMQTLREALALWRGPALADLTYEPFAQAEIARLEELRWAALEALAEARLSLGDHAALVPELERAAADQPLRERLHAQLMLALYRSGRQADALTAYRRARELLVEQIGVEPGAELRAMHAAVLAQDPALDLPVALPPELASGSPLLAGRAAELDLLRQRLDAARRGRGSIVLVLGPPGIGKTRLAAELARDALRRDVAVSYVGDATSHAEALAAIRRAGEAKDPTLLILDDVDEAPPPTAEGRPLLVLVLRRGPPAIVGEPLELGPLGAEGVAAIAALYGAPGDLAGGGMPLAVHRAAAEWARAATARQVAESASRAAVERTDLRAAEADVARHVSAAQAASERELDYAGGDATPLATVCPFRGLAPFEAAHERYFFGRERLVAELVARLVGAPLLAVVGPSGSGKSSVVRAGLLPALARGVLPGSEDWPQALMRPGPHPRAELERALAGAPRVLAVDQFEETFTACRDEAERAAFIGALVGAAREGVLVIVAMRADFYGRCAVYEELAELVGANQVLVGPLRRDELRRAIELPARRAGLTVEPALTAALIDDVLEAPGALPLLSAALLELWQERDGRVMRRGAYDRTGGVRGAVGRLAEQTYARLSDADRDPARRILVRLAEAPEGGGALVRRRVPLDELSGDAGPALAVLTDSRLVTVDEGAVEVAHEALLREWPRLRGWLDEDAEGRRLHQHLIYAARDWEAAGRDPGELYRGARLAATVDWAAGHEPELNARERDFVAASRAAAEEEADRQARANRRLRTLVAGIAAVLAVAIAAGVVALHQRGEARGAAVVADAQRLGAQALVDDRLDHALMLALHGVDLSDSTATRSSLLSVLLRNPAALGAIEYGGRLFTVAISPDGRLLAVGDERGGVVVYDAATREPVGRPYLIDGGLIQDVRFSPDGRTLAAGSFDPNDPNHNALVDLIDPRTGERRIRVRLNRMRRPAPYVAAATMFLPDGALLVEQASGGDAPLVLYRVDGGTGAIEQRLVVGRHGSRRFSLTADGRRAFLTSERDDRTWEVDPRRLRIVRTYAVGAPIGVVSPDGRRFAFGGADGRVRVLDLASGRVRRLEGRHRAAVEGMQFASDGRTLLTAGDDGRVIVWDVERGARVETFAGHTGNVGGLSLSGDGRTAVSAGEDGRVILWDVAGDRRLDRPFATGAPFTVDDTPRGIAASPDGRTLAYTGIDGSVTLVDAATLRTRGTLHAMRGFAAGVDFSPDGRLLAVCGAGSHVSLWDARTLAPAGALELGSGVCQAVVFSPDGRRVAASAQGEAGGQRTRVWDLRSRALTGFRSSTGSPSLAYSPDGRFLAAATIIGRAEVRDARTGRVVARPPTDQDSRSVAFSPDGRILVVGQYDGRLVMYATAGWRQVARPLRAHTARITYADFTPDGRTLATASAEGTVSLWDVATQKPIGAPLRFAPATFAAAAFSPGGRYLFAVSTSGPGIRFDMSPDAWKRHACLVAGHDLTPSEWADAAPGRPFRRICGG
jgi:WD40 repeat protein/DNA-binding SARP family transcriptional activator